MDPPQTNRVRNLAAFWLLGLCNNYAYVIMLSAAHNILKPPDNTNSTSTYELNKRDCNPLSTGTILLADILPSLFIKTIAPFIGINTKIRIIIIVVLSAASFPLVAFSKENWMAFTGVSAASLSSGLGETTLLSYASFYEKNVVSSWSSGTGASGLFGALSYAGMTSLGISPRNTLLIMLVVPVAMFFSFFFLLIHPVRDDPVDSTLTPLLENSTATTVNSEIIEETRSLKTKFRMILELWPYTLPLMTVYFAEYFINQGLTELIYFRGIWLNHSNQYTWYQVDYQLGVFISRSSVNLITINTLWILPILQFINVVVFLIQVQEPFLPSIWIAFALILYEGLLGGAAYVNTYYKMKQKIPPEKLEFSMAVVPLADTLGIAFAGAVAMPVHDYFCSH